MKAYKISQFVLTIKVEFAGKSFTYLYHTLNTAGCLLPTVLWNQVKKKKIKAKNRDVLATLTGESILVPPGTDEFQLFLAWRGDLAHSYGTIKSRVLVTRKCDNRCNYCTIKAEMIDMSSATAWIMDMLYFDFIGKHRPRKVLDAYIGGEPTLNVKVLNESAQRRFVYCMGRDIPYEFTVTSNGRNLTPAMVKTWRHYGLGRLHVSLSGPADVHNELRPSKKKGAAYHKILANLATISNLVPIVIEYQYDSLGLNFLRIEEMLVDLNHYGINVADIGLTPILPRREDNRFSGGVGHPQIMRHLKEVLYRAGFPVFAEPPAMGCMADLKSYLVFDADGSMLPCVALNLGEMAYGHINTGGIDYVAESGHLERIFPSKCRSCKMLPACKGGCRLQALTTGGDFNGVFCTLEHLEVGFEQYLHHKALSELMKLDQAGQLPAAN